jgi:hypothetical protein
MNARVRAAALGLVLASFTAPARAVTVEQVIEAHVLAKGGRAAWDAIETMRITGTCTAFSESKPFTLLRARPNRFHLDHQFGSKRVVLASDGEVLWEDSGWTEQGARAARGPDAAAILREADFATPLFDWKERGFVVKLLERADVDGVPVLGIELARPDAQREVWYLDPETHLELARDSPGSDFGRPLPMRTWYDDFRRVAGVMIPHLVEAQWYTRQRVLRIEHVEVNAEVDEALFRLPPPTGMGPLLPLVGTWDVAAESRQQPDAPWTASERRSSVESQLGGALLEERFTTPEGTRIVRTLSYDRYRKKYRLTEIDDSTTMMNLEEGGFDEQGRLVLSNLTTGTPTEMFGMTIHERLSVLDITKDSFRLEVEVSIDGGTTWFLAAKATYKRAVLAGESGT